MMFIYGIQINVEVFYKFIISFCFCVARHAQRTQNKNFAYLCNISKKQGLIDFLPADKHKNFLQVDNITLGVHSQACPKQAFSGNFQHFM